MTHRLSEFALIERLFSPLAANAAGAYDLRDDAATLTTPLDMERVVTVDTLVEGVHFLRNDPPDLIARKALRVNLSDLAAKGAVADRYLLALSIAPWVSDPWLSRFADGLAEDQKLFSVALIGGDTTATPGPLTVSVTAMGTVAKGRMLRRGGARPGDLVFVSGTVGDGAAGLQILLGKEDVPADGDRAFLISRYRLPQPRTALGPRLVGLATAAMDVSDGLLADLGHMAAVSDVGIVVEAERLPLSPAFRCLRGDGLSLAVTAATGGDDYEVAFSVPEDARPAVLAAAADAGTEVHEIGRVDQGKGVSLVDGKGHGVTPARLGFTHF